MRIVHVIQSLDAAAGGPSIVAFNLARAQAALGHEVGIVSYASGSDDPPAKGKALGDDSHSVNPVLLPRGGRWDRLLASNAKRYLVSHLNPSDIVHLHGVWDPILVAAAAAARRRGAPFVLTPHGMLDTWSMSQSRHKKRLALLLNRKRMLNDAGFLHVLNEDEQRLIEPLGIKSTTVVLPNGVFSEDFHPLPRVGAFRERFPVLGDDPFILFLSRLHYKKGLDVLIHAFSRVARRLPGLRLAIVGPDGGARDEAIALAKQEGVADRVHVLGPIYGKEKLTAFVDATCFCLPSRQEGFSVAITEALACGVPVVITEGCHFPEVAEVGAGEVAVLDAGAVAGALGRVCSDATLRQQMGQAGRRLVEEHYTWPVIAEQMVNAYQSARPG